MTGGHLVVENLVVHHRAAYPTLDHVSLEVSPGRCLAVLGESGAGKSTLCQALIGLARGAQVSGRVILDGVELTALDERGWQNVRWQQVSLAFQSFEALDPLLTVGQQIAEPMHAHGLGTRRAIDARTIELLDEVGLGAWAAERRPSELSGGQRRAVLLAIALACEPNLLLLDEPTAGLDPMARSTIVGVLERIRARRSLAMIVVTHDVVFAQAVADDVALLYRGWIAEFGPASRVLSDPQSPYAFGLLNAAPTFGTLRDIRGLRPPTPRGASPDACPFQDRCPQAIDMCATTRPVAQPPSGEDGLRQVSCVRGGLARVLEAKGLMKTFRAHDRHQRKAAVDGVDLYVRAGEVLGVAGLNAAGKSTLLSLLADHSVPDAGSILVDGLDRSSERGAARRSLRRAVQLVQQDPLAAVAPRFSIAEIVAEPLEVTGDALHDVATLDRVRHVLSMMRLPTDDEFLARRPNEVSGGELQRVTIARALLAEPKVLLLDEPASMLDPSEQAELLHLIKNAQVHSGTAIVVVSHDIAVLARLADRVVVLHHGRVAEQGSADSVFGDPRTDLVRTLVAAARGASSPPPPPKEHNPWNSTVVPS